MGWTSLFLEIPETLLADHWLQDITNITALTVVKTPAAGV